MFLSTRNGGNPHIAALFIGAAAAAEVERGKGGQLRGKLMMPPEIVRRRRPPPSVLLTVISSCNCATQREIKRDREEKAKGGTLDAVATCAINRGPIWRTGWVIPLHISTSQFNLVWDDLTLGIKDGRRREG